MLSQSLDDLGTTRGECLGRTRWSSPLDSTTYLYYFTSGCTSITTLSHVLPEHSMVTWPCHVIWLSDLPCYLYLGSIVRLDVRDQLCECMGNSFLPGALITKPPRANSPPWVIPNNGKDLVRGRIIIKTREVSQTSFGHISTNSSTILTVSTATESPWEDLLIGTSHALKRSVLAEILGRSTGNHHVTVYQIANIAETATI